MKPTIIKLAPNTGVTDVVTFEDAFGEYSELRGRGRARRKKRRLERIKNRREVQAERRKTRKERKLGRLELKAEKKRARRGMRDERLESRMKRKMYRKEQRVARRGLGKDEEEMPEEDMLPEGDGDTGQTDMGGSSDAPTASEEQGFAPEAGSGEETGGGDESYPESESEEGGEGEGSESEDGGEESEYEDEGSGFDGDDMISADGEDMMFADGSKINPQVKDTAMKIEWHKELISRLRVRKAILEGKGENTAEVDRMIEQSEARIIELEDSLQDYSEARGRRREASIRKREVRAAKKQARVARKAIRRERKEEKRDQRKIRKRGLVPQEDMDGEMEEGETLEFSKPTRVQAGLKPRFSPQRIEVPADEASSATGTGLTAIDDAADYDAPDTRVVELKSGFDGTIGKSKIKIQHVLIGVGVAALAIWAIRKYKLLGK